MSSSFSLKEFLAQESIQVCERNKLNKEKLIESDIKKQLKFISEVQSRLMGKKDVYYLRLHSEIGKNIEDYKVKNKRFERYLDMLGRKNNKSVLDLLIGSTGEEVLKRAEQCIETIYNCGYLDIIRRSMSNNEICIGKCMEYNLWYDNGYKICDISKICFNLVECDCISYLSRIKKREEQLPLEELIRCFTTFAGLGKNSEEFIKAMLSYPYEYMRIFEKMRGLKNNLNEEELRDKFYLALKRDGKSLM
jgi:hypothetical protein